MRTEARAGQDDGDPLAVDDALTIAEAVHEIIAFIPRPDDPIRRRVISGDEHRE